MADFIEIKANKRSLARRRLVQGVGLNDSDCTTEITINGKSATCPVYKRWNCMLERCYSLKYHKRQPTYIGCTVCDEWLTFSNFKAWMEKQDWKGKQLDKDLLTQGNKIYSPDFCLFVDSNINSLLIDRKASRGKSPQGVCFNKGVDRYVARVSVNGRPKHLGYFDSPKLAHDAYRLAKYAIIKEVALRQSEPLRSALLRYKIA